MPPESIRPTTHQERRQKEDGIETRIALVEKEIGSVYRIFTRFETALEKISEVSTSLREMIAVHENRLEQREKNDTTIFDMIERRKEEYYAGVDKVNNKLDDVTVTLRKQVQEEITMQYKELKEVFLRFELSQKEMVAVLNEQMQRHVSDRQTAIKAIEDTNEKLDKRVRALENWRWMLLGGGTILGMFVSSNWQSIQGIIGH